MAEVKDDPTKIVEAVVDRLRETFPPQHPSSGHVREVPARMSESVNGNGTVAALQAKVQGLEHQFDGFQQSFDKQIGGLADTINKFIDKVDRQFGELGKERSEKANADRSTVWIVVGIAVSSVIGLLGIGATFWSLSQAPVTTELARHDLDLREMHASFETRDELKANFLILSEGIRANSSLLAAKADRGVQEEVTKRLEQAQAYQMREHDHLSQSVMDLRKDAASKAELQNLNERVSTLSDRIQSIFDKNYALPKYPTLGGSVDFGSVKPPS